jgi:hypothetical protein
VASLRRGVRARCGAGRGRGAGRGGAGRGAGQAWAAMDAGGPEGMQERELDLLEVWSVL